VLIITTRGLVSWHLPKGRDWGVTSPLTQLAARCSVKAKKTDTQSQEGGATMNDITPAGSLSRQVNLLDVSTIDRIVR
jgi:hypothetical protein